jgi:hypothetical protein
MDEIIHLKIERIAKEFSIAQRDKKSPFRNVLAIANESSASIEVIKNYIRYQVGRKGSSEVWKTSRDKKLFATAVVEQIEDLRQTASDIVKDIRHSIPKGNELEIYLEDNQNRQQEEKRIHLKLAQLYLGYLAREHTAQVGENKVNQNI